MQEHQLRRRAAHRRSGRGDQTARPIWHDCTVRPLPPHVDRRRRQRCSTTRRRTPSRWRTMPEREEVQRGAGDRHGQLDAAIRATLHAKDHLQRAAASTDGTVLRISVSRATVGALLLGACSSPFCSCVIVAACALEPAREPSGQAHRRAAQRARPRASAGQTTPMRSSLRCCGASTASADRSTPQLARAAAENGRIHTDHRQHARGARAARREGRGAEHQPRRADALRRGRARASGRIS